MLSSIRGIKIDVISAQIPGIVYDLHNSELQPFLLPIRE
jgi:hypothetical protein